MKAMILAAGHGERMRPLTDRIPKPLLPIAGEPLIAHALLRCKMAGIVDVVINIAHLADQFEATLGDGSRWGVRIHYSHEEKALGMAGGVVQALPLLGNDPFLLMSGDIFCHSDLTALVKKARSVSHAHLVLRHRPPYEFYHLNANHVVSLEGAPKFDYAGFGIFNPRLFEGLAPGFREFKTVMNPAIAAGHVTGELFDGEWYNLTTEVEYRTLCDEMAKSS